MKKDIKTEVTYPVAKDKALSYLSFRAHSKKEIREKLLRFGAKDEIICEVIAFLEEYHLIDDFEFAKMCARDMQNLKKFGHRRIRAELFNKGISSDIIDEVLNGLEAQDSKVLTDMIQKRLKNDFDKKNKDKVIRYFITKGYELDEIKACIFSLEEKNT